MSTEVFRYTAVSFEFSANLEKQFVRIVPSRAESASPHHVLVRGLVVTTPCRIRPFPKGPAECSAVPRLEPILLPFRVLCKGVYSITNSCVETTHPPLGGSVVIFITSNSVIIQIWWLGYAKLSYVNLSSRIYFWFRTRLTLSFFPLSPLVPVSVYFCIAPTASHVSRPVSRPSR